MRSFLRKDGWIQGKELSRGFWRHLWRSSSDWNEKDAEEFLSSLSNHERSGMPSGSGTNDSRGFDLEPMRCLLDCIGNPQRAFDSIHVVGSKGKGSTAALLASGIRSCGYRVGSYFSPHVKEFTERIAVGTRTGNRNIQSEEWLHLVCTSKDALLQSINTYPQLSFFEVTTALALLYFQRKRVDVAVLEAGMGGIRDATNIVPNDRYLMAILTSIGSEHVDALGGSLESIIQAKVGIARKNKPLIVAPQSMASASTLIDLEADHLGVDPLVHVERSWYSNISITNLNYDGQLPCPVQQFDVKVTNKTCSVHLERIRLQLLGPHQVLNAVTAITALQILKNSYGFSLPDTCIREGIESVSLLGRFQILSEGNALKTILNLGRQGDGGKVHIVLDGAHEKRAMHSLGFTLKEVFPLAKLVYILAMASDKNHAGILEETFETKPEAIIFTEVPVANQRIRTMPASSLLNIAQENLPPHHGKCFLAAVPDLIRAQEAALEIASKADGEVVVVFTGSLHLVGKVLEMAT